MKYSEYLALQALYALSPEAAHSLAIKALKFGLIAKSSPKTSERLKTRIAGLDLPNPVGLAAGFDKNAEAIAPLHKAGFGFIEVGAATPLPQPGNAKPRLFRLDQDKAAINRFGFNNQGAEVIAARLAQRPKGAVTGLNLGANKWTENKAEDYARVLTICGPHSEFVTVNISSPNTEKLRDLQGKAALSALLSEVMAARKSLSNPLPVFLKIAPDLAEADLVDIAEVSLEHGIGAIIATNTTLGREGLKSRHAGEAGGLSGQPLFEKSTAVLACLARHLDGKIPLIGVGGVSSGLQAYTKIKAGASAVQLYTALVFGGFSLIPTILHDLERLLRIDGFAHVAEAVGVEKDRYDSP